MLRVIVRAAMGLSDFLVHLQFSPGQYMLPVQLALHDENILTHVLVHLSDKPRTLALVANVAPLWRSCSLYVWSATQTHTQETYAWEHVRGSTYTTNIIHCIDLRHQCCRCSARSLTWRRPLAWLSWAGPPNHMAEWTYPYSSVQCTQSRGAYPA